MDRTFFNLKSFLKTLTNQPGVYRMYNNEGKIIYVGKAKNLKKRISSYFNNKLISKKTESLVSSIQYIDITVTHTETEALILEQNYIKTYQPRYNILLRDDKSYPFIFLSNDKYPRLTIYRGNKKTKGNYFGPFPNTYIVNKTLKILQNIFPIRQCNNNIYRNRSRPCLQYQINRCLGPCIENLINKEEYLQQVRYVKLFLSGKDNQVSNILIKRMEDASQKLEFEKAIKIRDQIKTIYQITEKQFVFNINENIDVIGIFLELGLVCINLLFIRKGKVIGSNNYFPKNTNNAKPKEIVETFIEQFYLKENRTQILPNEILIDYNLNNTNKLINSIFRITRSRINIQTKPRGNRVQYLKLAHTNAMVALKSKLLQKHIIDKRLTALAILLKLKQIKRIECIDISHMMGEQTVASCVILNINSSIVIEHRQYNIIDITPGNDYAAIRQVLYRRYGKITIEKEKIPEIIIIDGGKNQLKLAETVFKELNVSWNKDYPILISIAKGSNRKNNSETIFLKSKSEGIVLPSDSPALHIIQYIRNESHNYAISKHREKLIKSKNTSILENIKGIGPKRRFVLLKYMGGLQNLLKANIEEIAKIPGISQKLATDIFYSLKR